MLQSVQQKLGEQRLLVVGLVEDSQLLLADTFSILEELSNATTVRPARRHRSAAMAQVDPTCVCSRWSSSAANWSSGAPC